LYHYDNLKVLFLCTIAAKILDPGQECSTSSHRSFGCCWASPELWTQVTSVKLKFKWPHMQKSVCIYSASWCKWCVLMFQKSSLAEHPGEGH